jgi:hypothetical protein
MILPMLYSSRKARHKAKSKAVFPDPTGLEWMIYRCVRADWAGDRNDMEITESDLPPDPNSKRSLFEIPSREIGHVALGIFPYRWSRQPLFQPTDSLIKNLK